MSGIAVLERLSGYGAPFRPGSGGFMLRRGAVFGMFLLACGSSPSQPSTPTGTAIDPTVSAALSATLATQAAALSGAPALTAQAAAIALQAGVQATPVSLPAPNSLAPPPTHAGADARTPKSGALSSGAALALGLQLTILNSPQGPSTQVYSGVLLIKDAADAALGAGTSPQSAIPPGVGLILEAGGVWEATAGQVSAQLGLTGSACTKSLPAFVTACNAATFTNAGLSMTASTPFAGSATGSVSIPTVPSGSLVGLALTIDCSKTALCGVVTSVAVSVSPATPTVAPGGTQGFSAAVTGTSNTNVTWTIDEGSAGGSLSTAGPSTTTTYTAPASGGPFHVRATSVGDPAESGVAVVTLSGGSLVTVNLSPYSAAVQTGGTLSFTATVSGTSTDTVTWSIDEAPYGGSLSSAGPSTSTSYTAPATVGTYHVRATSYAVPSVSSVAVVTVSSTTTCITEFDIPTASSDPLDITAGPDGNLWFTEARADKIGRITTAGTVPAGTITEFPLTTSSFPTGIAAGSDGNLWFVELGTNKVGRMTTNGTLTEFPIPSSASAPYVITAGPAGNLWFTESAAGANKIASITTAGVITEFAVYTANAEPFGITTGPDDNLWFTEDTGNKIGRSTTSGSMTEFAVPTAASQPSSIAVGSDGNLWFAEAYGNKIGQITTSGTITEFAVPTAASVPANITRATDGNLWFTESSGNKLARITTAGTITEFPIPTAASGPNGLAAGSDGNVWFVEGAANKVGQAIVSKCH